MSDEPDPLVASLIELGSLLLGEETLETTLRRVVTLASQVIAGCDFGSVTYLHEQQAVTIVATHEDATEIDHAQYASDTGPCLDAFRQGVVVAIPSIADATQWDEYCASALAHRVQSSLSLPMTARSTRVGALNLYGRKTASFDSVANDSALLFAAQAGAAVWNARLYEQTREVVGHLEAALDTRDVIGQAKGIVMANQRVSADEAFGILRAASQRRNVKLRTIAVEVAETGLTPPAP